MSSLPSSEPNYPDLPEELSPLSNRESKHANANGEVEYAIRKPLDDDEVSHDSEENVPEDVEKSYPACLEPAVTFFRKLVPYGGVVSNVFSLSSVTLGGAIISMPSSFATGGIAMSIIYLVVITGMTVYSMMMMGIAMRTTGRGTSRSAATCSLGVGGATSSGCDVAVVRGHRHRVHQRCRVLVTPLLTKSDSTPEFLKTQTGINVIVAILWLALLVPITIPKRVNTVRYVSVIGVSMVLYFVVCIVIHGSITLSEEGMRDDVKWFTTGNTAIYGLSIFVFAYMCQGVAFSVYYEMKPRQSIKQLTVASAVGMSICMIFYIMAGFFGYVDFGPDTEDSVLYNFDPLHQPYIMVAYIGMLVKICAAYGMNMIPVRNFHYHCLGWDLDTTPYWKHCIMIILSSWWCSSAGCTSRTSTWPSAWWGLCAAASSASCSLRSSGCTAASGACGLWASGTTSARTS
eukprot:gene9395-biopygen6692